MFPLRTTRKTRPRIKETKPTTITTTTNINNQTHAFEDIQELPRQPELREPGSWKGEKPSDISPWFFCVFPCKAFDNCKLHEAERIRGWVESSGQKSERPSRKFGSLMALGNKYWNLGLLKKRVPGEHSDFQVVSWNGCILGLVINWKIRVSLRKAQLQIPHSSAGFRWLVIGLYFLPKQNRSFLKEDIVHQNLKLFSYFFHIQYLALNKTQTY